MLFPEQKQSRCACCPSILVLLALAGTVGLARAGEPRADVPPPPPGVVHLADLTSCVKTGMQLDLAYLQERTGPSPAVVVIHGGSWQEIGGNRKTCLPIAFQLAGRGFVVATVSYRKASDAPFPAQIHDVKCAVRWLCAQAAKYAIDPDRIAALGYSSGGHLASLLGTTADNAALEGDLGSAGQSSRVQAVVNCYGPTDLAALYDHCDNGPCSALQKAVGKSVLRTLLGGTPQSAADRYAQASPLTHVSKQAAPTLLIHGTADDQVPVTQSQRFAAELKKAGVEVELLAFEKAGHAFGSGWGGKQGEKADAAVLEFLRLALQQHASGRHPVALP
jgi:acetyl esterase/lipase